MSGYYMTPQELIDSRYLYECASNMKEELEALYRHLDRFHDACPTNVYDQLYKVDMVEHVTHTLLEPMIAKVVKELGADHRGDNGVSYE